MSRVDFYSIITIVKKYISPERELGQVDLMYAMFKSYTEDTGVGLDLSQVSRWFNGHAKVTPKITSYYLERDDGRELFYNDIQNEIYARFYDPSLAMQELKELIILDGTISPEKKRTLQKYEDSTDERERSIFISELILFGLERPFVASGVRSEDMTVEDEESSDVSGFILNCEAPKPCRHFIGREDELDRLHTQLTEEKKIFVSGMGGIGKSELMKAYAKKYKKEYTNVLYLLYSGDLKQDLTEMDFADDQEKESDEERYKRHLRFLRVLREDTLLIVDNFDTTAAEEPLLDELLCFKCRILFATRSVFEDQEQFVLGELNGDDALYSLIEGFYPDAAKHKETIDEIIETVHRHTLAVELCARLLKSGLHEPDGLLEKLREEHSGQASTDKVNIKKDNRTKKNTYYGHIHTLFDLGCLDFDQREVMRHMGLMPLSGISTKLFAEWLNLDNMNTLNDLIELGLIREMEGRQIGLHPMMKEIVLADLIPRLDKCKVLLTHLRAIYMCFGEDVPYYRKVLEVTGNVVREIVSDDDEFFIEFLEDAGTYACTYEDGPVFRLIIDRSEDILSDESVGSMKDRALLYDEKAKYEWIIRKDVEKAREYQDKAIHSLPELDSRNAIVAINVLNNMAHFYGKAKKTDYEKAREYLTRSLEILGQFPEYSETHDRMMVEINYARYSFELGEQEEALCTLNEWLEVIKSGRGKDSLDQANLEETIAALMARRGEYADAVPYFRDCVRIYEGIWDDEKLIEKKKSELDELCERAGVDLSVK